MNEMTVEAKVENIPALTAWIDEELEKVNKLISLMEDKDWYIQNVSLGYALCVVEDKEDYKEMVKDWKLCKKSLKG